MNQLKNKEGLTEKEFLEQYDASKFDRPSVTVDMLLFTVGSETEENYRKLPEKELEVLLIKRADHPCMGKWALPGGFVGIDESLEVAATRELFEETNVEDVYMEQLYTFGDTHRDPRTRVISSAYMALVDRTLLNIKADSDADDAKWFTVKSNIIKQERVNREDGYLLSRTIGLTLKHSDIKLKATVLVTKEIVGRTTKSVKWEVVEANEIAFDHAKIISYGLNRLKNKVEYTDIAFNLMPELFTKADLQKVYEIILDKKLLRAAFDRQVGKMLIETDEVRRGKGHKPAKLFKFNPLWTEEVF